MKQLQLPDDLDPDDLGRGHTGRVDLTLQLFKRWMVCGQGRWAAWRVSSFDRMFRQKTIEENGNPLSACWKGYRPILIGQWVDKYRMEIFKVRAYQVCIERRH